MQRFFFDPVQETNDLITITGSEAHHITTVLRILPGAQVELYDGRGSTVQGEVLKLNSREVIIRILSRSRLKEDSKTSLTLAQAMLKGKKMNFLIQKATELGVHTFIPLITRYCEKRINSERQIERWQRIILESCKQCGRPTPMQVSAAVPFEKIPLADCSNRIMAWEDENSCALSPGLLQDNKHSLLLIGPEGGFHPTEVSFARKLDFITVSLGPRILRAETAALAAVTIIQHLSHKLEPAAFTSTNTSDSDKITGSVI